MIVEKNQKDHIVIYLMLAGIKYQYSIQQIENKEIKIIKVKNKNMHLRAYTHNLQFYLKHLLQNSTQSQKNQTVTNTTMTASKQKAHPVIQSLRQFLQKHSDNKVSEIQPYILLGICLFVVAIITVIVVLCCKKYYTRLLWNQSPEHFSDKPQLSLPQLIRFEKQIVSKTQQYGQIIKRKQTYEGKFIQVTFRTHQNCIYFSNKQQKDCYFEIQIVKLSSVIQLGFVHVNDVDKMCKMIEGRYVINLDQFGISVKTDGSVFANGNNCYNFDWRKIQYGDTIGIAMTKHEGGAIRVWITRNGVIENPAGEQQRLKYIQISKHDKQKQTIIKQKNKSKYMSESEQQREQQRKQRQQALAARKRIEIKATRQFNYYPVLISESPAHPIEDSIVNWNIGGQCFRLYDGRFMVGLLR